jgi:hypothetical protein
MKLSRFVNLWRRSVAKFKCQTQSYLRIGQRYLRMTQNPL